MNSQTSASVLVVEGGALRGVFSTGILDGFLQAGFNPFDFYIGVSSGASNLAAFLAEMSGRNYRIYRDYARRREFINAWRFVRGGHLMDLDWLWEITIREMRLDLSRIYSRGRPFLVGLTDVETGKAVYRSTGADDLEHVLKASSAIPVFYRKFLEIDGHPMTDGGITDAIPAAEAIRLGARRIMVIRSRQRDYVKVHGTFDLLLKWHLRHYPFLQVAIAHRIDCYNNAVALIRRPPEGVTIVEICPPREFRVSRLSQNLSTLREGYQQGLSLADEAIVEWEKITSRK
jgi:predicted patatin/cPLA2 family phospholipase